LRIGIVSNTTWNIFNFRLNIISRLLEEGFEVFVIAPVDEYITYKERFPTVKHISLKYLNRSGKNPFQEIILIEEFRRKYKKLKLDLVLHYTHKPNIYGTIGAKINGIKSISVITGLGYVFINKGIANFITKNLYRISARINSKIVFQNNDDLLYFKKLRIVSDPAKCSVIKGSGLSLEKYKKHEWNVSESTVFTFIGRLLKDKGIYEFVQSAAILKKKYPKLIFKVIGELDVDNPTSISRGVLSDWINSGLIKYEGFQKNVIPHLENAHCIILPSYREGMPRVVMEAQAVGRPVITTDVPGCRESIDDNISGYLVKVKSTEALVEGIEKFIKLTQKQRIEMGNKGRLKAEKEYSDKVVGQKIIELIQEVFS
jgi:glycosyltransferase involved in cell wall biosynthesis